MQYGNVSSYRKLDGPNIEVYGSFIVHGGMAFKK